jgi:putative membrane protein
MKNKNHSAIINFSSALVSFLFAAAISINVTSCGSDPDTGELLKKTDSTKMKLSASDKDFLEFAAQTNILEVACGKLAQNQGTSKEIKDMGNILEKDHKKALVMANDLGLMYGVELQEDLNVENQDAYDKLASKSGPEFDQTFCEMMVTGHKEAISKFESFANNGENEKLKTWARQTLPILRKHLEHAETALTSLGENKDHATL